MTREDFDKEMNLLLKLGHSRMAVFLSTHDQAQREEIQALRIALEGLVGCPLLPDLIEKAKQRSRKLIALRLSIVGIEQAQAALAKEATRDHAE